MKRLIKKSIIKSKGLSYPYSLINEIRLKSREVKLKCSYAVISFDDQSPVYDEYRNIDYGISNGILDKYLDKLIRKDVAITSFVIPNFKLRKSSLGLHDITNFPSWTNRLNCLDHKKFEIAVHGYKHIQEYTTFQNHCEFAFSNNDSFYTYLQDSLRCFRSSNLDVIGFRTPGWDLSSDIKLSLLPNYGIKYIGGSSLNAGFNAGLKRVSNSNLSIVDGLVNIPQNIEIDWDISRIKEEIINIIDDGGIISIKAHFASRLVANSLSSENREKLLYIVDYLNREFGIKWKTYKDLYKECADLRL